MLIFILFYFYFYLYFISCMRKRARILFGRITRILEKGKWQIFLVGERKISFFKKRNKKRKQEKENKGGFQKRDWQHTWRTGEEGKQGFTIF